VDAEGQPTHVDGWLLTFGYPYVEEPVEMLAGIEALNATGIRLVEWEACLYASYWLPPDTPAEELAALVIALAREAQLVPDDAHVEIALEYGL
jgi:hypothetical protein